MTNRVKAKIKEFQPVSQVLKRSKYHLSEHAKKRFVQRVTPDMADPNAIQILEALVYLGRSRPNPRKWMRGEVKITPGLGFVYWSGLPDVCALTREGTVVTIFTRDMFSRKTDSVGIDQLILDDHKTIKKSHHSLIFSDREAA